MKRISVLFLMMLSGQLFGQPEGDIKVTPARSIQIEIDSKSIVREQLPSELFGFNINYMSFQNQLWDKKKNQVYPAIVDHLKYFPSAIYRYPGGLVANSFSWEQSVGLAARRPKQNTIFKSPPQEALFGLDEYVQFLDQVDGRFLYVLNLVGNNPLQPLQESAEQEVADKNKELARYLAEKVKGQPRYYQLGNELDRSKYEWDADKYVARSRKTIDAIHSVDKDARYIAFLRDFIWKYKKDKARGKSAPDAYMKTVMKGLPEVTDYSLHHYYNGKRTDGRSRSLAFWLKLLEESIQDYRAIRGQDPNIWITEHARQMSSDKPTKDLTSQFVSNLGGALSTADYMIAIAQIPQIKGAVWHGLNAGPWQLFDYSVRYKDLRPRPIYYGLRALREMDLPIVMTTHTSSTNVSGYPSGYDVRAVAFRDKQADQLGLWVVNHSSRPQKAMVRYQPFASKDVVVERFYIAGQEGKDADDLNLELNENVITDKTSATHSKDGTVEIVIPPASVSSYVIQPQKTKSGMSTTKE
ncbi:hypothetical protein FT643_17645 [Ketobacter sp. MCCC 1A13808]|uniref:hypothetical protein n=1 Tax=Ketobacter sp. MCCC 1A13808 TaxID=2602738 RepID=UPI0012EB390B|nr:hypothetical protein [Ketobacter sp. MCCC 1A13808]MVF13967.1 hypothetical protein [Ketobacter sp. MCCC 1A13808]